MNIYIFPAETPNLNFVLAEDGMLLTLCGDKEVERKAALYQDSFQVEIVHEPQTHPGAQAAIQANKLRARFASDGVRMARAELFKWQYGDLPQERDARVLDVEQGVRSMMLGVARGRATWEAISLVLNYLLTLLPEQKKELP